MVPLLAGQMGLRFLILALVGLGSLYVLHLLAMDFQRIGRPIVQGASTLYMGAQNLFGKRAANDDNVIMDETNMNATLNWDMILQKDPFNCALSLICQIAAGAEKSSEEANRIYEVVSYGYDAGMPLKLKTAFELGQSFFSLDNDGKNRSKKSSNLNYKKCYSHYPTCLYSAKTMLKLLEIHSRIFGP